MLNEQIIEKMMELAGRIVETVELIQGFDRKCRAERHTDTRKAWEILDKIRGIWRPFYQESRKEGTEPQTEENPDISPDIPKPSPEGWPRQELSGQVDP